MSTGLTEAQGIHTLDLELGQPVEFTWTLSRAERSSTLVRGWEKVWVTERWPGQAPPPSRRGIVVGVRTLADGLVIWNGGDGQGEWRPTRHFGAYLVAYSRRRKLVRVLPQHLRAI